MESLTILMKGLAAGLIMCAPVGPIGILCARHTLLEGRLAGLFAVLGGSAVDALYCSAAGFGVAYASTFLHEEKFLLELCGGLILMGLGIHILRASAPSEPSHSPARKGLFRAFTGTFLVTLSNPMPLILFTALFTATGIHGWRGDYRATALLVAGVLAGSTSWAPILVTLVSLFKVRFNPVQIRRLNHGAGGLIFLCGLGLVLRTLL